MELVFLVNSGHLISYSDIRSKPYVIAGDKRPPKSAAEKAVTISGAAIRASAPCLWITKSFI